MKNKSLLVVFAAALLSLGACAGGNGGNSSKAGGTSKETHLHTFDETKWESNDTQHWHPATCEHTTQKGNAANHTFEDVAAESVAPDCGKEGKKVQVCTICGKKVETVLPKTDHDLEEKSSSTNSEGKTVKTYECKNCHNNSYGIDVNDGNYTTGGIGVDGKMEKTTVVVWKMPVAKAGKVSIQLPMKMSSSSHSVQDFAPAKFIIKVNDKEATNTLPSGTYEEIGLTMDSVYFNFAEYTITDDDVTAGEISIEFDHNSSGYRLLFVGELRISY